MRLRNGVLLVFLGCSQALAAQLAGEEIVFRDDFERGDFCAWSNHLRGTGGGNLTLLQDAFDTAAAEPHFRSWSDIGTSVTETGGQLVIDVGSNVDGYAGYESIYLYDLRGGWIDTSVAEVTGSQTILEVRNHLGNAAQIIQEGNDIIAAIHNVSGAGQLASRSWNPAERYWRISEDEGDMVWAVSSDRQSWDELHRLALPFEVAHVRGALSAGGSSVSPSQARFDDVNAGPPIGLFCATDTLRDDFAAAPLLPPWEPYAEAGCSVAENGGDLAFTYTNGTGSAFCGLSSLHLYDMSRGDGITVDGTGFPAIANFVSSIQAFVPGTSGRNGIETSLDGNELAFRLWVNDAITDQSTLLIDRTLHRYWRMRGQGTTAIFETSDGTGFIERWRVSAPFQLTAVYLDIGAGHYDTVTVPLTVRLPGVNAN
jgi:hypothetical protein